MVQEPPIWDVPSWESFAAAFPSFEITRVEDSLVAICDQVRAAKMHSDTADLLQAVAEATAADPVTGFETLKKRTAAMMAAHTIDNACDIRSKISEVRDQYLMMKSAGTGLRGRPWPWPALNDATLGLQNGHLVTLYGRPKSGKSTLVLEAVRNFHAHGARPIVFSQELPVIEICERYVALVTCVDFDAMQRGALSDEKEEAFLENLEAFSQSPPIIVDRLTSRGEEAIVEMAAKIDDFGADLVVIDGVYFLGDDWRELTKVTRGMKSMAMTKSLPIIGVTQANRSRNKKDSKSTDDASDIAYGDSFYQDSDLCVRVTSDIENRQRMESILYTSAVRSGKSVMFSVNMYNGENMTQKNVIQFGDAENDVDEQLAQDKLDGEEDARV